MKTFFEISELKESKNKDWVIDILNRFGLSTTNYSLSYKNNQVVIYSGNHKIISKEINGKTQYEMYSQIPPLHKHPKKTIII